jgi:hypothetical protein
MQQSEKHPRCQHSGRSVGESFTADQRLLMYSVISKPKRKSVAVGVCHCMRKSPVRWRKGLVAVTRTCVLVHSLRQHTGVAQSPGHDCGLMIFMNRLWCGQAGRPRIAQADTIGLR